MLSFIYKGGSIIIGFLLVPLTIKYLNTENYGIWLTLSSFVGWFSFFDIGLGNGLRNKFAEAKAKGDMSLAKGYVSTAYFTISLVSFVLILIFSSLIFFIDWSKVFNTSSSLKEDLSLLMPIIFGFFCIQLVAQLITTIYTADQKHSVQGKINFYVQAFSLLLIWIMTQTNKSSLLIFGAIFSIFPVIILIGLNFFAFNTKYKIFKPSFQYWKREYLKDIFGLGFNFFLVQMSGIILYSTDNFIISKLFSPADVVPFNIAFKYTSIPIMIFTIIAAPFWSSITDAYYKSDYDWIKKSIKNLLGFSLIFSFITILMILFSSYIYNFWIGPEVKIPLMLSVFTGVFTILTLLLQPFIFFINGIGKLKVQLITAFFSALLNIPLSVFLAKNENLGISGVVLATILCFIPGVILGPIQYYKIINKKDLGLWSK